MQRRSFQQSSLEEDNPIIEASSARQNSFQQDPLHPRRSSFGRPPESTRSLLEDDGYQYSLSQTELGVSPQDLMDPGASPGGLRSPSAGAGGPSPNTTLRRTRPCSRAVDGAIPTFTALAQDESLQQRKPPSRLPRIMLPPTEMKLPAFGSDLMAEPPMPAPKTSRRLMHTSSSFAGTIPRSSGRSVSQQQHRRADLERGQVYNHPSPIMDRFVATLCQACQRALTVSKSAVVVQVSSAITKPMKRSHRSSRSPNLSSLKPAAQSVLFVPPYRPLEVWHNDSSGRPRPKRFRPS